MQKWKTKRLQLLKTRNDKVTKSLWLRQRRLLKSNSPKDQSKTECPSPS